MTNALLTREQYVAKKAGEWAEKGARFKERRQADGLTLEEVSCKLGISTSTLRRFEMGQPVRSSNIIEKAYEMCFALKLYEIVCEESRAFQNADYLIDQELGGTGKIEIRKKEYTKVAEIDTGCLDLNVDLAIELCEKSGGEYYFTY